jgi:hypothetical protein
MTGFVRDLRPIHRAHHAAIVTLGLLVVGLLECSRGSVSAQGFGAPSYLDAPNAFGVQRTVTLDGAPLQLTGPFFQSLGTNGRTCATCHVSSTGWTLSPADLQSRYDKTGGTDPVFRPNDGANSPAAAASATNATELRAAYSMLLNRGVIRVALPIPAGAQFTLAAVSDPYGNNNTSQLSLFRRPLPSTNLRFLTGVMFDGRESATQTGTLPISAPVSTQPILPQLVQDFENLIFDLGHQANDATLGHAQAMVPGLTTQQINQIVAFELNLATAQNVGSGVGSLSAGGALGGPYPLILQPFYVSINDSAGGDVFGNAFNPVSMTLFNGWQGSNNPQQASIARGQAVFNTFPLTVNAAGVTVNCTSCHGTPNVGNRSLFRPRTRHDHGKLGRHRQIPRSHLARCGGPGALFP